MSDILDKLLAEAIGEKPVLSKEWFKDANGEWVLRKVYPAFSTDPAMALKWLMALPPKIDWSVTRWVNEQNVIEFRVSLTWDIGTNPEGDDIIKNIQGKGDSLSDALVAAVVEWRCDVEDCEYLDGGGCAWAEELIECNRMTWFLRPELKKLLEGESNDN